MKHRDSAGNQAWIEGVKTGEVSLISAACAEDGVDRGPQEIAFEDALTTLRGKIVFAHASGDRTIEASPGVPSYRHSELAQRAESEIRSRCELRSVIQVLPYGSLPKTEFEAKRVRDLRNLPQPR